MTLEGVRFASLVLLLACVGLCVARRERVAHALRVFFGEPTSALNLGLLRAYLFWKLLFSIAPGTSAGLAAMPSSMRTLLPGWGWTASFFPFSPSVTQALETGFFASCALAMVGLWSRVTAPLGALLAIYIVGLPNFHLKVDHGFQAIVLCACVVAAARCGDALSLDRLWRRYRGTPAPGLDVAYTVPVRFAWLFLGTVYLFPGVYKLWESGDLWLNGHIIQWYLYPAWGLAESVEPLMVIDRVPFAYALLGIFTLVLEIGFIFALFNRTTRVIAALCAVAFHAGIAATLKIRFHVTLPLILLLDLPGIAAWLKRTAFTPQVQTSWAAGRAVWIVGSVLLVAEMGVGAAGIHTWPVSVHPRFAGRRGEIPRDVNGYDIILRHADGSTLTYAEAFARMGKARGKRLLREMVHVVHDKPEQLAQSGRAVVQAYRSQGVRIVPGDELLMYKTQWRIKPFAERKGYKRLFKGRFRVTEDDSLVRLKGKGAEPRATP